MEFRLTDRERRAAEAGLLAAALAHLLAPRLLLAVARRGYRLGLAVEFQPTDAAARRVRLVGLAWLGALPLVRRLGE